MLLAIEIGHLLDLIGRNGWHVALLVLWEVLSRPSQDASHALQQHAIRLFDLRASI